MSKSAKALAASVKKPAPKKSVPEPGVGIGNKLRTMSAPPPPLKSEEKVTMVTPTTSATTLPWEDEPTPTPESEAVYQSAEPLQAIQSVLKSLASIGITPEDTNTGIPVDMPMAEHKEVQKTEVVPTLEDHPLFAHRKKEAPIHANTALRQPVIQNATFGSSTSPLGTVFVNTTPVKKEAPKKSTAFFASSSSSIG